MNHFDHHTAASLADALSLLTKFGDEAKVIAGGTDLLVNIRNAAIAPRHVIDLKSARDLSRAEYSDHEGLRLGALLTLSDLASSEIICEKFNMLTQAALSIRSQQIRNMGTLGGNLCQDRKCVFYNQSHISLFQRQSLAPCSARSGKVCYLAGRDDLFRAVVGGRRCWAPCPSDLAPALVSYEAEAVIAAADGRRTLPLSEFITGPGETALRKDELLVEVKVPTPPPSTRGTFLKYARSVRDFAIASVAVQAQVDDGMCKDARIVLGGVAPFPLHAAETENALKGKQLNRANIEEAARMTLGDARIIGPATDFKVTKTRDLVKQALENVAKA